MLSTKKKGSTGDLGSMPSLVLARHVLYHLTNNPKPNFKKKFISFLAILGFELKVFRLLSRCSTT
jgi:hypothetical protein